MEDIFKSLLNSFIVIKSPLSEKRLTFRIYYNLLFSCPVGSNSLQPHRLQHARPPCPSPSADVCPSLWPLHHWCHPAISSSDALFSFSRQSFLVSGSFSNESAVLVRWPKYWSFSISPSSEYSGLIPFRIDWFDLLAVQRTLRSLLQHHSSKASILWCSAFFTVQLSQLCVITGKTIALTRRTFVGKAMSLLFNTLSRLGCSAVSDCLRPHGL